MAIQLIKDVNINGTATIAQITNATVDTDKFLVSDGGIVKYRTGVEVLSDLGIQPGVANTLEHQVKAGVAINIGQAVYVTSADGTNMIVGLSSNATEATSSKTMGLLDATVAINGFANVVTEGLLAGLDTSAAVVGDPVWLGTGGNLIYGLANKPSAPQHLVYIGIVTRVNLNNGEIFVSVQNGFELQELHNVSLTSPPANDDGLFYETATTLWKNKSISTVLGYTPASDSLVVHLAGAETITGAKTFQQTGASATCIYSQSSGYGGIGVYGIADNTGGIGLYGKSANTSSGYAGKFDGRVQITDNLGIGTTNPGFRLEVVGALNGTAARFYIPLVDNFPSGASVPDCVKAESHGHNGTSASLVSCFYGIFDGNKGVGLAIENTDTLLDSTNSVGVRVRFKGTSTTNIAYKTLWGSVDSFIVSDSGNGYFLGKVGIGTPTNVAKLSIKGLVGNEAPVLGSELLSTGSGTGWTGGGWNSGGYTTTGTTSALTSTFAPTIGQTYQLIFSFSGGATCSWSIGGSGSTGSNNVSTIFVATTTATFVFNTLSSVAGTVTATVKAYAGSSATVEYFNSSGVLVNEMRSPSSDTNHFSGLGVGAYNIGGLSNTGVGSLALSNNMGASFNTALGAQALQYVSGSGNNTALGAQAGTFISSPKTTIVSVASNSTFVGYRTSPLADSQTNQIVIGHDANGIGNNTTVIGNSATVTAAVYGNLLLGGTSTVGAKLYVTGSSVSNGASYWQQQNPTALTATATLTIAQLNTNIITVTSATAVSLTLPTGTLSDAGILTGLLPNNNSFDWNIINLGSSAGAVTLLAGTGHTIVGATVTAIGTSSTWRTRKTATNTFITYRIN